MAAKKKKKAQNFCLCKDFDLHHLCDIYTLTMNHHKQPANPNLNPILTQS